MSETSGIRDVDEAMAAFDAIMKSDSPEYREFFDRQGRREIGPQLIEDVAAWRRKHMIDPLGAWTPDNVRQDSEASIAWRCPRGHTYYARVCDRVAGQGCPECNKV